MPGREVEERQAGLWKEQLEEQAGCPGEAPWGYPVAPRPLRGEAKGKVT